MIVINGRFLSQRLTGIQRFAYEICCALQQIGMELVILAPENIEPAYDLSALPVEIIGGKGSHFWEQVTLPRYMKRHYDGCLLLSLSGLSPLCYANSILTVHDVSYLLRPRSYSWLYCLYYQIMTPLAAKRAKKILTVSEFSKSEILRYIPVKPDQIEVVYNAVRAQERMPREKKAPYILTVASKVPRKNVKRLLEAYSTMPEPAFELYVAGGQNAIFADAGWSLVVHAPGIRFLGYVSEDELTRLYRNATAYINPSLYEGFGIPLVEAMSQECPVLASDIPAFHEVCGDAALYFDPMNTTDMQDKMRRIVQDEALRTKLQKAGNVQRQRFSWTQSAQTIQKIIRSLC